MKRRKKLIIIVGTGVFCLIISMLAIKLISDGTYKNQMPSLPDFANVSKSLVEQITVSDQNVRHHPSSENLGFLGMVYNSNAYYDQAVKCYELAVKKDSRNWIWNYYSGYIKLELGDAQSAITYFDEVTRENPQAFMALYYTGVAWQSLNSNDLAEKVLSKIAGMDNQNFNVSIRSSRNAYLPVPAYAKFQLARIFMNTNRPDLAENQLKEIIRTQITFGPAYRQLSSLYATKGDSTLSRYYSLRASDLIPYQAPIDTLIDKLSLMSRSDEFLMKQIDLAIRSANSQWADELLIGGLKYFSGNKFFISKAIKQFLSTGNYDQAIPLVDRHFKYFSDTYNELILVGIQLADAGFKSQAKKYFLKAVESTHQTPEVRSTLALLLFEKVGLKENAENLMNDLIEKNPMNVIVLTNGGFLFLEIDQKDKTLQLLEKLRKLSPLTAKVICLEGIVAEQDGKLEKAIGLFEQSFKADPKDKYLLEHLSTIYLREKMWPKAIDYLKRALLFHPNNSSLQVNLGGLLLTCADESLRNIGQGIEYSERAFINYEYTYPIRISAGRSLAIAYDRLGDRTKAIYYINKTIDFAGKAHVSRDYLKNLQDLSKEFSSPK